MSCRLSSLSATIEAPMLANCCTALRACAARRLTRVSRISPHQDRHGISSGGTINSGPLVIVSLRGCGGSEIPTLHHGSVDITLRTACPASGHQARRPQRAFDGGGYARYGRFATDGRCADRCDGRFRTVGRRRCPHGIGYEAPGRSLPPG